MSKQEEYAACLPGLAQAVLNLDAGRPIQPGSEVHRSLVELVRDHGETLADAGQLPAARGVPADWAVEVAERIRHRLFGRECYDHRDPRSGVLLDPAVVREDIAEVVRDAIRAVVRVVTS